MIQIFPHLFVLCTIKVGCQKIGENRNHNFLKFDLRCKFTVFPSSTCFKSNLSHNMARI